MSVYMAILSFTFTINNRTYVVGDIRYAMFDLQVTFTPKFIYTSRKFKYIEISRH